VAENPKLQEFSIKQDQAGNSVFARIIYNRRLVYVEQAIDNYFLHFSPNFLFLRGDINPRHSVGNVGQLYFWQFPFIIAGIVYLFKKNREVAMFLLGWILLSPLPASFSFPAPHALRSLLMLPPLIIFTACGVYYIYTFFKSRMRLLFFVVMAFIILCSSLMYLKSYVIHNSITASSEWGDGYRQLINNIRPQVDNYDKVIISGHFWQPYMYTLFYTQYDPKLFQKEGTHVGFGKFIFGGTSWDQRLHRQELDNEDLAKLSGSKNVLVALSPGEYASQRSHINKTSEIKNHKGDVLFVVGNLHE